MKKTIIFLAITTATISWTEEIIYFKDAPKQEINFNKQETISFALPKNNDENTISLAAPKFEVPNLDKGENLIR